MKKQIFKHWTVLEVEEYLDLLSKKTGLDWRCMILQIDDKMKNSLGEFSIKRDKNNNLIPYKIRLKKKLFIGIVPENIVADIITHEFMHFYTTVKENKMVGHSKEYKQYCKEFGFGEEVYSSTISLDRYLGFDEYKYLIKCSECDFVEGRYRMKGNPKEIEDECLCPDCNKKTLRVIEKNN